MSPPIVEADRTTLEHDQIAEIRRVDLACEHERGAPEILVPPAEHLWREFVHLPEHKHGRVFLAPGDDGLDGYAWCTWEDLSSNRKTAQFHLRTLPGLSESVSATLLHQVLVAARDYGCCSLITEAPTEGHEAEFLQRAGLEARLREPRNAVWTRDLPVERLTQWVEDAATMASGYKLIGWDGACPDEWLRDFADLWLVMNTAPLDDLDWEPEEFTPQRCRAEEAAWSRRGITPWTVVAIESATGTFAGFTTVLIDEHWPEVVIQEDTGVRPEHRGYGLGKWLKAVNALRLLDERPDVEVVVTWNAGSNAPMLAINHAMGFRTVDVQAEWQGAIDDVRL